MNNTRSCISRLYIFIFFFNLFNNIGLFIANNKLFSNIITGEEKTLYLYNTVFSGLTSTDDFCSISYLNPYVFIVHSDWRVNENRMWK